jgi:transposase-like protein
MGYGRGGPHGKVSPALQPAAESGHLTRAFDRAGAISELCEKYHIHPTLFYQWQKTFFENGAAAFERERPRSQSLGKEQEKINRLETKLKDRNEALAELMEEHVRLKKELGEI